MATVKINTPAPDFTSLDSNGNSVSLSDFINRKHVLLVFNRGFF